VHEHDGGPWYKVVQVSMRQRVCPPLLG